VDGALGNLRIPGETLVFHTSRHSRRSAETRELRLETDGVEFDRAQECGSKSQSQGRGQKDAAPPPQRPGPQESGDPVSRCQTRDPRLKARTRDSGPNGRAIHDLRQWRLGNKERMVRRGADGEDDMAGRSGVGKGTTQMIS
jgi:hypothetical protein